MHAGLKLMKLMFHFRSKYEMISFLEGHIDPVGPTRFSGLLKTARPYYQIQPLQSVMSFIKCALILAYQLLVLDGTM